MSKESMNTLKGMDIINEMSGWMCFFFFQAEDGIRDYKVTGVQTCALPICMWRRVLCSGERQWGRNILDFQRPLTLASSTSHEDRKSVV